MKRLFLALLLAVPTAAQAETVAFVHARVHQVQPARTLTDATVVVLNGKISAVGTVSVPAGATVVDCHGHDLFPSLIEPDSTLGLSEIEAVKGGEDYQEVGDLNADLRADTAVNPDSDLLPPAMSQGILVAGVSPRGGLVAGRGAVMELRGWTREDMTVKAPSHLIVTWPSMGIDRSPDAKKTPDEQARARNARLDRLSEIFENARAYARARQTGKPYDTVWEAMQPFVRGELPVFVRAELYDQIVAALKWREREKVQMVLVGGYDAAALASEIAAAHVSVIFTHVFEVPARQDESFDRNYRAAALLTARGVSVSLSTDGGNANVRWLREIASVSMANGLSPERTLAAITLEPARALGVGERLGSLEAGKEATFFLANGDILDGRTVVERAWIRGREVDLNDRQKKLYERYRNRP